MRRSHLAALLLLAACGDGPAVSITSLGGITSNGEQQCEPNMSMPPALQWDTQAGAPFVVGLTLQNDGDEPAELTELTVEIDNQGVWEGTSARRKAKLVATVAPDGGTLTTTVELLDVAFAEEVSQAGAILDGPFRSEPLRLRLVAGEGEGGQPYEFALTVCHACLIFSSTHPELGPCEAGMTSPVGCAHGQRDGYTCEP